MQVVQGQQHLRSHRPATKQSFALAAASGMQSVPQLFGQTVRKEFGGQRAAPIGAAVRYRLLANKSATAVHLTARRFAEHEVGGR